MPGTRLMGMLPCVLVSSPGKCVPHRTPGRRTRPLGRGRHQGAWQQGTLHGGWAWATLAKGVASDRGQCCPVTANLQSVGTGSAGPAERRDWASSRGRGRQLSPILCIAVTSGWTARSRGTPPVASPCLLRWSLSWKASSWEQMGRQVWVPSTVGAGGRAQSLRSPRQ